MHLFLALPSETRLKGCMATSVSRDTGQGKPKLLDRVRDAIRFKHYSLRTEQVYVDWIKRFILFHGKRHPEKMGAEEVRAFLSDFAANQNAAASTQNQALSALLFPYREVLKQDSPWISTTSSGASGRRCSHGPVGRPTVKNIQVTGHRPVATSNCSATPEAWRRRASPPLPLLYLERGLLPGNGSHQGLRLTTCKFGR